jgi:hypothetical protein
MTSAKDRIRAGAERARMQAVVQPQPGEEQEPVLAAPVTRVQEDKPRKAAVRAVIAPRQKDIRKNVDLSPDQNDRLGDWQRAAARELGVARVTAQDVLVALVERLLTDPDLSEQIKKDLHSNRF